MGTLGTQNRKPKTQAIMETLKIELHLDGGIAKFLWVGVARSKLVFSRLCNKTLVTATFFGFAR